MAKKKKQNRIVSKCNDTLIISSKLLLFVTPTFEMRRDRVLFSPAMS